MRGVARARAGRLRATLIGLWLVAVAGCSQTLATQVPVLIPARVPVRAFPQIWVSGGQSPEEIYLQDRLAAHLAQDGYREVRRVDAAELEPARQAGRIDVSTVVVWISGSFQNAMRRYWDTAPVQYCGFYGCAMDYQSYLVRALEVSGKVELTVYEGPTARVLQQERFEHSMWGESVEAQRGQVLELLATELEQAVDVLRVRERFVLYRVDIPEVKRALAHIKKGDWDKGREELEAAAKKLGGHKPRTQARVWYNLGLARWLAPGEQGLTQRAYEAALRALHLAQDRDPQPAYQGAIEELKRARERFAVLEAQRSATEHNFAIARKAKARQAGQPDDGAEGSGGERPASEENAPPGAGEAPADSGRSGGERPASEEHAPPGAGEAPANSGPEAPADAGPEKSLQTH